MKVLYLTKYTDQAASSRMRSYQYFPYFENANMDITVRPFFNDDYIKQLYSSKPSIATVLKSYLLRFFVLFTIFKYDKVVIEKEIFPYVPAFAELILKWFGIKYIVDYDDAIFHNYDQRSNPLFSFFLKNKIAHVMRFSGTVVAGNSYLAQYAKNSGAKNVEIIPTVIDLERYQKKVYREGDKFIVGWIGTKTTFEKHLLPQKEWIKELLATYPDIDFHVIGIPSSDELGERVTYIPWTQDSEVDEILKFDVGLMPLEDSLWERGKCAYKLIQYAACGIPGIASDVGMNKEVTLPNQTGLIAYSNEEWISSVLYLKNNPSKKIEMGSHARELVEQNYCIQVTSEKWMDILQ